jgi:hypothetical protein
MRFIKKHYFLSPPRTDADLISLGLKPVDTIRSPIPPSDAEVIASIGLVGVPYAIDADPAHDGKLPFARTTRRRERFNLEGNSGKTAWFSLAYRNGKNQVGSFCPPFSAVIP